MASNKNQDTLKQDLARIPPLGFDHINMLGRYQFDPAQLPEPDSLRPLRDPSALHLPIDWGF